LEVSIAELYAGLGYRLAVHFFRKAGELMESGRFPEGIRYCRTGLQVLGRPWIDEPGLAYLDHSGDRIVEADLREKRGDCRAAYGFLRSAFVHRCECYFGWMRTRGIEKVMER